jgi:hypothetical protein
MGRVLEQTLHTNTKKHIEKVLSFISHQENYLKLNLITLVHIPE